MNFEIEPIEINLEKIHLLNDFVLSLGPSKNSFRYFNKRELTVIKNHICTLGLIEKSENKLVAYGHLENEANIVWLGIAIHPSFQGIGLGSKMMDLLLAKSYSFGIKEIFLSVDKENTKAINLYKKFCFKIINSQNQYFIMKKDN
jgi:RimJ/RimL family protein N-acetyltransferase